MNVVPSPVDHLDRLMEIARTNRVGVHFLPADRFPGIDWDGLYLITREFGAAIAIRSDMEPEWRDWVLGHELGHHFRLLNATLFSPFRAHKIDSLTRRRWSGAKRLDPDEDAADQFLREADAGLPVKDLCRRHGFSVGERGAGRGHGLRGRV